jgi:chromosomal replication initiation ATPase DnaA
MTAAEAWQYVLEQLEKDMPRSAFDRCVRDARLLSYIDGIFIIAGNSQLTRAWLEARLTSTVERLLAGCMNRSVEVKFVIQEKVPSER